MDKKEYRDRLMKTFFEGFIAALLPDIGLIVNQVINDREIWWTILLPFVCSAIAGGISAVLNSVKKDAPEVEVTFDDGLDES